jgi:IS5 family transposase
MATKVTGQAGFIDGFAAAGLGRNDALDRLSSLVKWYRFEKLLAPLRDAGAGRPAYPPLLMFKALLLLSLYGLSDAELEQALGDRLSFRRFVGLGLNEATPDHTTLCRFRNLLNEAALHDRLFAELDRQLDQAGLILRRGTMLDATVIESRAAPPTPERPSSDPDARFVKRQGKPGFRFGYKAHVGVDQGSGLIRSVVATPANVNDTVVADALVRGDERAVLGDGAYHTHARERALRARGIKPRLMRRANKHHPVLPPRVRRLNQLIARQRGAVETTFATLKRWMGLDAIRYRGLQRATGQIMMAAISFNMRRWARIAP